MDIPILFGRYLVRNGKISEEQLSEAIKVQYEINRSFAVTALENEYITLEEFKKALACQRNEGIRFREALRRLQIASDETIEKIDNALSEKSVKLGELLVLKGLVEQHELNKILADFREKGTMELL
ncbi:MAG: hypothetical protein C4581_06565 [Nitrospiraceae bacterium]|nr:MAG: hypothetical protein C4581_06565 [Nitrospiraceae bacterium]